jgi:hypothetical protein
MSRYSANITAGTLMLPHSRRIAALLLTGPTDEAWDHAIRVDNLLQKNTPATAMRQARLIRARLEALPREGLTLVVEGSKEAATQVLLVGALRHSALLRDFMGQVLAAHHRKLDLALTPLAWEPFLADCTAREPAVAAWTATTRAKLFQVLVRMLVEAGYLESAKTLRLRTPDLHPDVRRLLKEMGEDTLIDTLELRA